MGPVCVFVRDGFACQLFPARDPNTPLRHARHANAKLPANSCPGWAKCCCRPHPPDIPAQSSAEGQPSASSWHVAKHQKRPYLLGIPNIRYKAYLSTNGRKTSRPSWAATKSPENPWRQLAACRNALPESQPAGGVLTPSSGAALASVSSRRASRSSAVCISITNGGVIMSQSPNRPPFWRREYKSRP